MKIKIFAIVSTLMALVSCNTGNNFNHERLAQRLDSVLEANYRADAPGVAVIIALQGEPVYERYIGIADMATGAPIDAATRFNIASCSKQMTAVSALLLEQQGAFTLDDSVKEFFPEFESDIWNRVRLHHLLSQSSGVPDLRPRDNRDFMIHATDEQSLEYMVKLDSLHFTPGTHYEYVNPTFQIFYALIPRVSDDDFLSFQQANIFDKAGMTETCYFDASQQMPNMAHGYIINETTKAIGEDSDYEKVREAAENDFVDGSGRHWAECDYGEETFFATKADGGVYSTPRDLLKWENALVDNKIIDEKQLLKAYSKHTMVSGSVWSNYQNRPHTWYGYGWFIDTTPGREEKVYHTGDNGGFQAYLGKYPESGVNVIMLENRNDLNRWQMQLEIERILIEEGLVK